MKLKVYNLSGALIGEQDVPATLFDIAQNPALLQRAVRAQQAASRQVLAHTKTRSEVRGGGRKPWRQKGTGRARHGSIRSPLWVGGGVTFGPRKNRNFLLRINKKEARKALRMALSLKAKNDQVVLIDKLELPKIQTKALAAALHKLPTKGKTTLLIQAKQDAVIAKSARNLPSVTTIAARNLNIFDVLRHRVLMLPVAALDVLTSTFVRTK
ncbi:MAG: 50S ribosomal protein L4 [Candidatus Kerfeldbacteria bacterium]|nr:50S ribosomal protein L4 [Candidatus Kerfeldbacteria bacterium]